MLIRIRNRRKTSRRKIKSSTSGDVQASEVDTSVEAPLARAEPAETKKAFNQKAGAKKAPAAKSGARKNSAAKAKAKAEEPEAEKIKTPPVSGSEEEYKMDAKESVLSCPVT